MVSRCFDPNDTQHRAALDALTRLCYTGKGSRNRWMLQQSKYPCEPIMGYLTTEDIAYSLARNGIDPAAAALSQIGGRLQKISPDLYGAAPLLEPRVLSALQDIQYLVLQDVGYSGMFLAIFADAYRGIAEPTHALEYLLAITPSVRARLEVQQ